MDGTKFGTDAAGAASLRARGSVGERSTKVEGGRRRPLDSVEATMPARVATKRVGSPLAENLRFPGEGKSAQGQSGPKPRPKGVGDGCKVNIPMTTFRTLSSDGGTQWAKPRDRLARSVTLH